MANYFLVIDGVGENKSGHEIEEIEIEKDPFILGLVKGEEKSIGIQKKPGYFTELMLRYWISQTPILKIRLMLVESEHYETTRDIQRRGNKTITTETMDLIPDDRTNPYTFLDCKVADWRESENGYFQVNIIFVYTTVVKNTPTLPKPTLPDKKPSKAQAARKR